MTSLSAYIVAPPIAKAVQRASLLGIYLALIWTGLVSALVLNILVWPVGLAGLAMSFFALTAGFGVVTGWYRWEWVSLIPLITLAAIHIILLLPSTVGFSISLLVALILVMSNRYVHLHLVARTNRILDTEPDLEQMIRED